MNKDAQHLWDLMLELGRRRSLRDPLASLVEDSQLTPPQLHAISWLGVDGELPISVLAQRIGASGSSTTGLIDRLEKQQLVARAPSANDRRVVLVSLTPEGEALASQVINTFKDRLDLIMSALKPADRRALIRLVTQIDDALASLPEESGE